MTPEQLAAIKARADKATAGPWEVNDNRVARPYPFFTFCVALTDDNGVRYYVRSTPEVGSAEDDFAFIAHARTDVPALVAEVERLRKVEAAAKAFLPAHDQGQLDARPIYHSAHSHVVVFTGRCYEPELNDLRAALRAAGSGE